MFWITKKKIISTILSFSSSSSSFLSLIFIRSHTSHSLVKSSRQPLAKFIKTARSRTTTNAALNQQQLELREQCRISDGAEEELHPVVGHEIGLSQVAVRGKNAGV
jgi:hypothetical protein